MALEVYEVDDRPGVRRLDHPDAQDVFRTSYKKGVITDFKKVSDDPLRVEAMVKVQVEGYDESDYIPIFYKPKAQYWDDPTNDIMATDFDEENQYYKQAWMSFRCGDEVVVLMQANDNDSQLEPKYILGFIDNYPRLGENAMLVRWSIPEWWCGESLEIFGYYYAFPSIESSDGMELIGDINVEQNAPDGVPLSQICNTEKYKRITTYLSTDISETWYSTVNGTDFTGCQMSPAAPLILGVYTGTVQEKAYNYKKNISTEIGYVERTYFVIGPIMFCFEYNYILASYIQEYYRGYYWRNYSDKYCSDYVPPMPLQTVRPPTGWDSLTQISSSGSFTLPVRGTSYSWSYSFDTAINVVVPEYYSIYAQIYTDELWENPDINSMIEQSLDTPWPWEYCDVDKETIEFIVPAHTKQELIDAGLINTDGTLPGD